MQGPRRVAGDRELRYLAIESGGKGCALAASGEDGESKGSGSHALNKARCSKPGCTCKESSLTRSEEAIGRGNWQRAPLGPQARRRARESLCLYTVRHGLRSARRRGRSTIHSTVYIQVQGPRPSPPIPSPTPLALAVRSRARQTRSR
jgi:hypothetical protein